MTPTDWLTIAGGLALGYIGVSFLMDKKRPPPPAPPKRPVDRSSDAAPPGEGRAPEAAPPHWTEVLGIGIDASIDDVRNAYKREMSRYHPDKVASLGVELRELAERKSKQIGEAYRQAMAARGEFV